MADRDTMQSAPVYIAAGGTGGHVFPALAVAERLRELDIDVIWVGTRAGIEDRVAPENRFPIEYINVSGLRGKSFVAWIKAPLLMLFAVIKMLRLLVASGTACVLCFGGYASAACAVAAVLLRKPILLQEQNSIAGTTNKYLAPFAAHIFTGFPNVFASRKQTVYSGNPLRRHFVGLPTPQQRQVGAGDVVNVLVVGGSLGAAILNSTVPAAMAMLSSGLQQPLSLRLLHQTGEKDCLRVENEYQKAGVSAEVVSFIDDMAQAYAQADLVIARSGALTVSEIAAVGVAAIFVPYPHAIDDHQTANARHLASCDAAVVIPQCDFDSDKLHSVLTDLLSEKIRLQMMAEQSRRYARLDAAEMMAEQCRRYVDAR